MKEYPFDFERYIAERLREIDDLDERQYAKKILAEGLGNILRETEKKYRQLEERIYRELELPDNRYQIVTTVVREAHYDPTNHTLFPVFARDLKKEEWQSALSSEGLQYAGTVFLKTDRRGCAGFEAEGRFPGEIPDSTGRGRYVDCRIKKAGRYREAMEELYEIFQKNGIPWRTVNIAYLDKFYDVFLETEEAEDIALRELSIDFGPYAEAVCRDMLPLWNLEPVTFDSKDFMLPCIDGMYYEHEFDMAGRAEGDGYLIRPNQEILEIRYEKEKIILKSAREAFEKWGAIRLAQGETVRSLDYDEPFLANARRDTFLRRYSGDSGVCLSSKMDLFRRVFEIDPEGYLELADYEILEAGREGWQEETMNWFVRDELFPLDVRRILLLKFREKNPGCYLSDSLVWFVVSQLQLEISEFRCAGVLLQEGAAV
ncbi:MAG: hypothetical protein ACI4D5_04000 [Kineothrix sp.]